MKKSIKQYSAEEISQLALSIEGEEESYKWLIDHNCKELAALSDVIINHSSSALDWLKQNNFETLVAFESALAGDNGAIQYLLDNKCKEWAAVIGTIEGEAQPLNWLLKNKYQHFVKLSKALADLFKQSGGGGYIGGGDFGGGGGGGDGFGGGDFGGGGDGGSW